MSSSVGGSAMPNVVDAEQASKKRAQEVVNYHFILRLKKKQHYFYKCSNSSTSIKS